MQFPALSRKAKQKTQRRQLSIAGLWIQLTQKVDRMSRKYEVRA